MDEDGLPPEWQGISGGRQGTAGDVITGSSTIGDLLYSAATRPDDAGDGSRSMNVTGLSWSHNGRRLCVGTHRGVVTFDVDDIGRRQFGSVALV
jgi:hypothetical protein